MLALGIPLSLVCVLAAYATAVNHWITTKSGVVAPSNDFEFESIDPYSQHLSAFVFHDRRIHRYRSMGTRVDEKYFFNRSGTAIFAVDMPDVLSKSKDYNTSLTINITSIDRPLSLMLSHKGLDARDYVQLDREGGSAADATPMCSEIGISSKKEQPLLAGLLHAKGFQVTPEPNLLPYIWLEFAEQSEDTMPFNFQQQLAAALADALSLEPQSWIVHFLSGLYWRAVGDAVESVHCFRHSLNLTPDPFRDLPLVGLAAVLNRANRHGDALVLVDSALSNCDTLYLTHILRGNILLGADRTADAASSFAKAIQLNREMTLGFELLLATLSNMKQRAAAARREREINFRRLSMVLPSHLTWDDFDFETSSDRCAGATCTEHAECSDVDGKCHCMDGWLAVQGRCVADDLCSDVTCKANAMCRGGRCYCRLGYMAVNNECVRDPCAGVECVEHAVCDSAHGLCKCISPYVAYGAECVTEECVGIRCGNNSFCQRGRCFCRIGYKAENGTCVKDTPCHREQCPAHASCREQDGHCRCSDGYAADMHRNRCIPSADGEEPTTDTPLVNDDDLSSSSSSSSSSSTAPATSATTAAAAAAASSPVDGMPTKASDFDTGVFDPDELEEASLQPTMAVGVKPGTSADMRAGQNVRLPFEEADFVTRAKCTRAMRRLPSWEEFSSSFLPPDAGEGMTLGQLVNIDAAAPTTNLRKPHCPIGEAVFSAGTMDHIPSLAINATPSKALLYPDETGLKDIGHHLFGFKMPIEELGHRIAEAMERHPAMWAVYDLATLYWRVHGKQAEALLCIRAALFFAPPDHRDVPLVNAANVLLRINGLEDARAAAEVAVTITAHHKAICHFTLGNTLAAMGNTHAASEHYKEAIRYQPSFELAQLSLRRVLCAEQYPLADAFGDGETPQERAARERLHRQVRDARALKTRLEGLKRMIEAHGDARDASSLKKQLRDAEERLEAIFLRQKMESQQSTASSVLAALPYKMRRQAGGGDGEASAGAGAGAAAGAGGGLPQTASQPVPFNALLHDLDPVDGGDFAAPASTTTAMPAGTHGHEEGDGKDAGDGNKQNGLNSGGSSRSSSPHLITSSPSIPALMEFVEAATRSHINETAAKMLADPSWPTLRECSQRLQVPESTLTQLEKLSIVSLIEPTDAPTAYDSTSGSRGGDGSKKHRAKGARRKRRRREQPSSKQGGGGVETGDTLSAEAVREEVWRKVEQANPHGPPSTVMHEDMQLLQTELAAAGALPMVQQLRESSQKVQPVCRPHTIIGDVALDAIQGVANRHRMDHPGQAEMVVRSIIFSLPEENMSMHEFAVRAAALVHRRPDDWQANLIASFFWRATGNSSQAIECLRVAYAFAPPQQHLRIIIGLANVLTRSGRIVDAMAAAETAIRMAPTQQTPHATMAHVLSHLGSRAIEETLYFFEAGFRLRGASHPSIVSLVAFFRCQQRFLLTADPSSKHH